jgi:hypothetical protein
MSIMSVVAAVAVEADPELVIELESSPPHPAKAIAAAIPAHAIAAFMTE